MTNPNTTLEVPTTETEAAAPVGTCVPAHRSLDEIRRDANALKYELHLATTADRFEAKCRAQDEKAAAKKAKLTTNNGLTIQKLEEKGFRVVVEHIRYVEMDGVCPVLVPISNRLKGAYPLSSTGGATHIVVMDAEGNGFTTSSVCHVADHFETKYGVVQALNQIHQLEADFMLQTGLTPDEETASKVEALLKDEAIKTFEEREHRMSERAINRFRASVAKASLK